MKSPRALAGVRCLAWILGVLLAAPVAQANGTLTGRVTTAAGDLYLPNVRIVVEGRPPVFTNAFGEYRVEGIPPGPVRVTASFTGLPEQEATIAVGATGEARQDFRLSHVVGEAENKIVQLDPFTVQAARELDARAIAMNEQRYAASLKNVVSTDEFGDLGNTNVGDFIKFMPGVVIDDDTVSIRGLPSHKVPVTMDGDPLATTSAQGGFGGNFRTASLDNLLLDNLARVEISKSRTPEMPADALGGAVNMVSKRAFERKDPVFKYRTYLSADLSNISTNTRVGPSPKTTALPIRPGGDFSYIAPLSKTLGVVLTGSIYDRLDATYLIRQVWAPHMVSRQGGSASAPYLAQAQIQNNATYRSRAAVAASVDWKVRPQDVISVGGQYIDAVTEFNQNTLLADVSGTTNNMGPASYGPTFTQGALRAGRLQYAATVRKMAVATMVANGNYRHTGERWEFETRGYFSRSGKLGRDIQDGHFRNTQLRVNNATIRFDDINAHFPGVVTAQNSQGQPVNPFDVNDYSIATVFSEINDERIWKYGGSANISRKLDDRFRTLVKLGLTQSILLRDQRGPAPRWNFVGPDGNANSGDDLAMRYDVTSDAYRDGGGPHTRVPSIRWPDQYKLYSLYTSYPEYFRLDEVNTIVNTTAQSRKLLERVSAAYIQADLRLLQERLRLVGGVRFERSDTAGEGQLNDIRATYQQNADGSLVRDALGRPIRISSDAAVRARAQYADRGAKARKAFGDYYPSLNATWSISENLVGRFAFARAIGKPDLGDIVPGINITDPTAETGSRTITITDPRLKPWTGDNWDLALEYYLQAGGVASVGIFRKDIKDFFGRTRSPATIESLAEVGLGDDFLEYDIIRNTNVGDARIDGAELNYRQALGFLPHWARGIQVFGNVTTLDLQGSNTADFDSFVRLSYSWGVSLTRPRFSIRLNWHERALQRRELITGTLVPSDTYRWVVPYRTLDLNAEYRIARRMSLYAVVRNVTNAVRPDQVFNGQTPSYARQRGISNLPVAMTLGLKGEF